MPPRTSPRQRKRLNAKLLGVTNSVDAFEWVAKKYERINIIIEGDSWFAYPSEWLVFGPHSNIVDHIFRQLIGKKIVNTLSLASNGDTSEQMLSGKQLDKLTRLLEKRGYLIDLCLFSAGGNDVVGPDDLSPLIHDYVDGLDARQCINKTHVDNKMEHIASNYRKLLDLRNQHAPNMKILCHTYDFIQPRDQGAEFLWGVEIVDPWIYPTLVEKQIPQHLHFDIIKILLEAFKNTLLTLEQDYDDFYVVDTQGTLTPGKEADWADEIHPSPSGFNQITQKIYKQMRNLFPQLPDYNATP